MNKVEIHKNICDNLNNTYKAKNADYGDSFARVRKEEGQTAILVRLKDKLYRLETLLHGADRKVSDESLDDTLIDLANYCILELVERYAEREARDRKQTMKDDALFSLVHELTCEKCVNEKKCHEDCSYEGCDLFCKKEKEILAMVDRIKEGTE